MNLLVTGAAGSGTSTLASALAEKLGTAHLEADDYFWLPTASPFTKKRDRAERLSLILGDRRKQRGGVVAGSVVDWGDELEDGFDLIVFLYLDKDIRIERLKQREIERFGRFNPAFLEWASQYDEGPPGGRSLAKHQAWLQARRCPRVELHGDLSVNERVAAVMKHLRVLCPGATISGRTA